MSNKVPFINANAISRILRESSQSSKSYINCDSLYNSRPQPIKYDSVLYSEVCDLENSYSDYRSISCPLSTLYAILSVYRKDINRYSAPLRSRSELYKKELTELQNRMDAVERFISYIEGVLRFDRDHNKYMLFGFDSPTLFKDDVTNYLDFDLTENL